MVFGLRLGLVARDLCLHSSCEQDLDLDFHLVPSLFRDGVEDEYVAFNDND